ncbi:MAG: hypothetical protein ACREDY_23275 [Bradyrhizobium sp.]
MNCRADGLRRLATGALLTASLMLSAIGSTPALEFKCVEPSRYRNLLSIFNDDPNLFFSYFGLPRSRLPDMASCRSLHISGTLADGDADALLDRIILGKGWLAVIHLSVDGTNLVEEARLAAIVRSFFLKTRGIRHDLSIYGPDFTLRWDSPIPLTGTSAAAPPAHEDISPLQRGMKTYLQRRDFRLKVDRNHSTCNDGCRTVWTAGVNRLFNVPLPGSKPEPVPDPDANKRRVAMTYALDWDRLPPATDPLLAKPLGWTFVTPPAVTRMLRDKCSPEFAVAESLEARWGEAFAGAERTKLRPREIEALATPFETLSRAGARLQQCLAAAMEAERLASFRRLCAPACDRRALSERFSAAARDMLEKAGKL